MEKLKKNQKCMIFIAIFTVCVIISGILVLGQVKKQKEVKRGVEIANRYLSELKYDEAIACFQEILEIDPKNSDANFALAEAYQGKEMYVYAESIYQKFLDDDKRSVEAYIDLAELYMKQEKLEEAKQLLEEAKQRLEDERIDELYKLVNPSAPRVSHEPGVYTERIRLEIIPEEDGQIIYYTLDGSEPTEEAEEYDKPLILRNGITTLKAVAVNTMGYRSNVAEFIYDTQIADIEITLEEPAIEQIVRDYLKLSYREPIYNDDIEQITELYLISDYVKTAESQYNIIFEQNTYSVDGYSMTPYGRGAIQTLNDLRYMPFLETVAIEYQPQLDISALSACTSVRYLSLMGDDLHTQDIQAISELTQLEKLNLGWNEITDLSAISGLTNLTHLSVWGNQIVDITPAITCKDLIYLDFSDNQVTDISTLSQLEQLEQLWMYDNQVTDISSLAAMSKVHVLMLRDNPIANPEAIRPIYAHLTRLDVDLLNLGSR